MNSLEEKLKNHHYGVKTVSIKVTDLDEGSRQVKGYFSSFDTIDSDRDVIRKGAFSKSINERGPQSSGNRKIAHLRNHDWEQQIGNPIELFEDSKGLGFVSQMGRSTKGQDAFLDYQDGILREHSIGFNYIPSKMQEVKESPLHEQGHWEINEVKLWEGSGVTFGANSLTPVIDVAKGLKDNSYTLKKLNELTITLEGALKNGKGTDERLVNIEQMFAQLKQLHNSLELNKPSVKDTSTQEPKKSVLDYLLNT
jgi:HK97 family phage prohead protease